MTAELARSIRAAVPARRLSVLRFAVAVVARLLARILVNPATFVATSK